MEKILNLLRNRNGFSFLHQHVDDLNDITKEMKMLSHEKLKSSCQLRAEAGDPRPSDGYNEVISLMNSGGLGGVTLEWKTAACNGGNGGLLVREEPVPLFCLPKRYNKGHARLPAKWYIYISLWRSVYVIIDSPP